MNLFPALQFLCFIITFTVASNNPTHFTGDVSINCGSTGPSTARNGREWLGDIQPRLASLLQLNGVSTTSTVIHKRTSVDPVPHNTARISRTRFSYSFQVNPGQKIIRLHFNPSPYKGFRGFKDFFSVGGGPFTLLGNFSASITADALGVNIFTKEFCLNIQENQQLNITFSPESSQSLEPYAFINGIEIISVPASLSYFHGVDTGLQMVGQKSLIYVDNGNALEIIQRLNIKQDHVPSAGDFDDMFPKWAIERAKIKNNTWKIPLEVGFRYLIRLHFPKKGDKITGSGDVIFKILVNEMIAHTNRDILNEKDGNNIVLYRDYLVVMRGLKEEGKRDLVISLQLYDELIDGHEVLAGFEVVKLSNHDNSLASPNPQPQSQDSPSKFIQILLLILDHRNVTATVTITIISVLNIIVHKLREIYQTSSSEKENKPSIKAERLCRRFSLYEIQLATNNFSDGLVIGRGGFGKVYKGLIDKREKTVAIKRLKSNSRQGAHEFLTEIETLSELRHINLVSLIGYCSERREMILVYEYMANGTLADHLYRLERKSSNLFSLTWTQRLNICIGAARGLEYLHTGHRVIHRDVKTSNILLDETFVAKVADFGLAKPEDRSKLQSHVSTKVKGTFGYFDPYYFTTQKLTRKSDTYAFGVVLLETLCGRPALDPVAAEDERLLTKWAQDKISKGEVDQIVASSLREEISVDSFKTYVGVAERCLSDEPKNRPTMSQVVVQLELALEQEENKSFFVPNHTAPNANDNGSANEGIVLSETAEQTTEVLTYVQTVTSPANQTNSNYSPTEKREGKKLKVRAWDAFWNRIKPSRKKELRIIAEIHEADIKLPMFDFTTIATATNQFSYLQKIGQGGSSSVYKAVLPTGRIVAAKRYAFSSQTHDEFRNEILLVSGLHHRNIIKLLGYCVHEQGERILVYDYMVYGQLYYHLHKSEDSPLTWKQRLQICIGAAKGLHYLHGGADYPTIHRDVKSANILLDEKWVPKISDFGQARLLGQNGGTETHVSTLVCGTLGYLDPEYFNTSQLTEKSDVYSFGVVLFEVLCGKPAIFRLEEEPRTLAQWVHICNKEGILEQIIDPNLEGQIAPTCFNTFFETAISCLSVRATERPAMSDIVWSLESAMQLQVAAESKESSVVSSGCSEAVGSKSNNLSAESSEILKPEDVFSMRRRTY